MLIANMCGTMSLPRTFALAVLLAAGTAGDAAAQSPAARETALTGMVRAVSGAAMQAVSVRVFEPEGTFHSRNSEGWQGQFRRLAACRTIPCGDQAPEFTTHVEQVAVPQNALTVVLQLLPVELAVDVSAADELVAGGRSLTSTTISGDALLDLPRNEEHSQRPRSERRSVEPRSPSGRYAPRRSGPTKLESQHDAHEGLRAVWKRRGGRGQWARRGGWRPGGPGRSCASARRTAHPLTGEGQQPAEPHACARQRSVVASPLFGLPTGYTTGRTVNVSMSLDF